MKKVIWIIVAVVLLVVIVVAVRYRQSRVVGNYGAGAHVIQLHFVGTGSACALEIGTKPGREQARRQEPFVWLVDNDCAIDADVEIRFSGSDPLEDTDEGQKPGRRDRVRPGAQGDIRTRVRPQAAYDVYPYTIVLNSTNIDPEVEVVGQEP